MVDIYTYIHFIFLLPFIVTLFYIYYMYLLLCFFTYGVICYIKIFYFRTKIYVQTL